MRKALIVIAAVFIGVSGFACDEEAPQPESEEIEEPQQSDQPEAVEQDQSDEPDEVDQPAPPEEDDTAELDGDFEYPDFGLDELDEGQREQLVELASVELCPCEDAEESLHDCMQHEERCEEADEETASLVEVVADDDDERDAFERRAEQRADDGQQHDFELDGPYKGNPDADVIIVEFADFQCPHCRVAAEGVDQVYERFGGDVGIFFKNYPVGGQLAEQAARAALAAHEQDRFWEMHQLLFENQRQIDATQIEQFAQQLGLNMERFRQDMESREANAKLAEDRREGAEAGVTGTPAIFINGERYTGHYSGEAMGAKVASLLE